MRYFNDRQDAGIQLAATLKDYQNNKESIVLALPRGGVPIAYEISQALNIPLNVFMVRKLGVPGHEELAMGAIAEGEVCVFNQSLIDNLNISADAIQAVQIKEKKELERRLAQYRQNKPLPSLNNKTVILVDDGIATGATVKAALLALKEHHPKSTILATPVASQESLDELRPLTDKTVCLLTPEPFGGVGAWYQHFDQTSDEEVMDLLSPPS